MAKQVVASSDIRYSLIDIRESDIQIMKDSEMNHHEIVGYNLFNGEEYLFYSVEDNYTNPIKDHWTTEIVKSYDNHTCWLLIKEHPCSLYKIITDIFQGNYVFNVYAFDIWETDAKNCLVGMITEFESD